LGGGTTTTLVSGSTVGGVAVDSTNVYWTDPDDRLVLKVPVGGGTPVTVAESPMLPTRLALDATSVYWIDQTLLLKAPK
jgi:hypothetical protein